MNYKTWGKAFGGFSFTTLVILFISFAFGSSGSVARDDEPTAKPTVSASPSPEEDVNIEDADGELRALPTVGSEDEVLESADTTDDIRTPATFLEVRATCGDILSWKDHTECIDDNQWYKDAVNARATKSGFSWSDIEKWSSDPQLDGTSQLVIQVYSGNWSDDEARAIAAELISQSLADKLSIARHPASIANTRSDGNEKVSDFHDPRNQVRVSLAPVVYNADGTVKGLRADAGIFIDCLNIWWLPKQVCTEKCVPTPPPASPPPTSPPPVTPPPPYNPPVCPPDKPYGTYPVCKDGIEAGSNQQGKLPVQQQPSVLPTRPDHYQPTAPATPAPVYTPAPAAPAPTPAPGITPNPTPAPGPPPPPPVVVEEDQGNGPSEPTPGDW